jgi:hypothetical protein
MASVYETFDEKGLDAALAGIEHAVPAEAEPSDEPTPEEHEQIVMQVCRRLSMRATKHCAYVRLRSELTYLLVNCRA